MEVGAGYKQTEVGVIPEEWGVSTVGHEFEIKLGKMLDAERNVGVLKPYSSGIPIQISVYAHQIVLWNAGQLPERWTLEKLLGKHPSPPFNPLLASAFFRAGYVESWGRGIEKIHRECANHDAPAPIFDTGMSV